MSLNIEKMSIKDKLKAIPLLWDDICHTKTPVDSPQWHADLLQEREQDIKNGKDSFVDWNQAKKDILDSLK